MANALRAEQPARVAQPEDQQQKRLLIGDDRALLRFALILGGVLMMWRLYVACISNVIWEEGHFVVSGAHLGLAYPDIPGGFAWLSRLITLIFGWHVLPLRIVSMLIATAIPYGVYFMATPVVSHRNALWAAIVAMLMPTVTMNGTVYYPEGSLQLLLALMCGFMVRALKDPDTLKWWLWAGVTAMAGLLVHYRFLVPGLAAVAFLGISREGRRQWGRPGIYIVGGLGVLGLLPSIIYNAMHGWPAIQFHVVNRVVIDPDPRHIIGLMETQLGLTTPIFFAALCGGAWTSLTIDRNKPGAFLGYQSAGIFLFYCIQAIINKKIMPHWPFMAYVPVLAYAPGALIGFAAKARSPIGLRVRLGLIALGPILALVLGGIVTYYQCLFVHSAQIAYPLRQMNVLKNENYSLLEPDLAAADARARARFGPGVVWAASGHISAVHLEFPALGHRRDLYTLDEPYDVLTSRFVVARHDWGLDRSALMKAHAGQGVVLAIIEPSFLFHDPIQAAFSADLCRSFDDIEPFRIVTLPPGRTAIDLFTARVRSTPLAALPKGPCALVPNLYIAHPMRGQFVSVNDHSRYFGMAADPKGVTRVDVMIDHKVAAPTRFGFAVDPLAGIKPLRMTRFGFAVSEADRNEPFNTPQMLDWAPGWPNLQYDFQFPKGSLTPGQHVLTIRATHPDGTTAESDPRILYVTKGKGPASYFEKPGPVVTK